LEFPTRELSLYLTILTPPHLIIALSLSLSLVPPSLGRFFGSSKSPFFFYLPSFPLLLLLLVERTSYFFFQAMKLDPVPFRTDAAPAATPNRTRRPLSMATRKRLSLLRAAGYKGPILKTTPIVPTTLHHTKHTSSRTAKRKTPTQKKTLGKCKPTKSRTKAERKTTKT
jgi:hypothetical protein